MTLRPFSITDAETILSWCRDKHAFRFWSANRYNDYPAQPEEMMEQYEDDNILPLVCFATTSPPSNATSPSVSASQAKMPIRLTGKNGKVLRWN